MKLFEKKVKFDKTFLIQGLCAYFIFSALNMGVSQESTVPTCSKLIKELTFKEWGVAKLSPALKRCPLQADILRWSAFYRGDKTATFAEQITFIKTHPNWPWLALIKKNAEKAALKAPASQVLSWFRLHPPTTLEGADAYVKALYGLPLKESLPLLRQAWAHLPLSEAVEASLHKRLSSHLRKKDKAGRAYFYLDCHQPDKAQGWIEDLSEPDKRIIMARIAFQKGRSAAFIPDPGVIRDAVTYYRKQKDTRAISLLKKYKAQLYGLNASDTWKEVHCLIRGLFEKADYVTALELVKGHQGLSGPLYLEAAWLEGWLEAKINGNFQRALEIFTALYTQAKTPISRAKAAFWAGEAYSYKGNKKQALAWYKKAAAFPTTFYGQEALAKLNRPMYLPSDPHPLKADELAVNAHPLIKAAKALLGTPLEQEFKNFLFLAIKTVPTFNQALVVLKLALRHIPHDVVGLAKETCLRFGKEIYGPLAFPLLSPSLQAVIMQENVDLALVHGVIRKESGFNPGLISSANAHGLMQVLPSTGKMVLRKHEGSLSPKDLLDNHALNVRLGARYLRKALDQYHGCPILTLAAYNAGPKWANTWQDIFGSPATSDAHRLKWIEIIPYGETRNYIQRVIEGTRTYLYLLNNSQGKKF